MRSPLLVDKIFVGAKLELESLDCGIFGISHGAQCVNHCASWQDLTKGCHLSSGRLPYATAVQLIKRQIRKGTRNDEKKNVSENVFRRARRSHVIPDERLQTS